MMTIDGNRPLVSIITPAFCEQSNLPVLHKRLRDALDHLDANWEWIIVDDHSTDDTFAVASRLANDDAHVRCIRLSRNCGSHVSILCGLKNAEGDCAVVFAADLQDEPEAIPSLFQKWREGAQIVWAVRAEREGVSTSTLAFSRLYWWLVRNLTDLKDLPGQGADFFLIDREPLMALAQFEDRNVSTFMLIAWMGFRQAYVSHVKRERAAGTSGWTLTKRIKLVIDSLVSFSYVPIRAMSIVGVATALTGLVYAIVVIINYFFQRPSEGWSSLMVAVLVVGGVQMLMLGVLGEYIWRGVEEARRRPRYLIEATVGGAHGPDRLGARDGQNENLSTKVRE
jgi:glycosyltransferase involved in cell wall biosynthesis